MATQIWVSGAVGDWATGSNWQSGIPPATGDLLIVSSGFPTIDEGSTISGVEIVLGGEPTASAVSLAAIATTFEPADTDDNDMQIRVSGGHPVTSPLHATFIVEGDTSLEGQIIVQAMGGNLTIESMGGGGTPGNFTLKGSTILVTQESFLALEGDMFTNGGLIQIDGGMRLAAGATLTGSGSVVLEAGGRLTVEGDVEGHQINFADGTGSVTLINVDFDGVFGFTTIGGAEIDVAGVAAQSDGFLVTPDGTFLTLYAGPGQTGSIVATLAVQMIDAGSLFPVANTLTADDFDLSSDGKGGTLITYAPAAGPIVLQQALPVAVVAAPTTSGQPPQTVALSTILLQSFGTTAPNFIEIVLLPTKVATDTTGNNVFWGPSSTPPQWLVGGQKVTQNTTVTAIDDVQLLVGNQINWPAQFQAQTTPTASGPASALVVYDVWTVSPDVVDEVEAAGFTGLPTPAAIVASAQAFAGIYGAVPNNDLCNWIADNVAAGAGASMPPANFALDPTENQPGGFWRIVYSGAQPSPVIDWSSKVQPGDIVRMGWLNPEDPSTEAVSGHTTTVLGAVTSEGLISVYDNIAFVDGIESIGIHDAGYWVSTNPADITIYRLDPRQQYLIEGSGIAEQIQGSVFNDLIQPSGGADVIAGGPGNNVIQGTTAELAGISVVDFGPGDLLSFTDLAASGVSVLFSGGVLDVYDGHAVVASIVLPPPEQSAFFFVTADGSGGSYVGLVDPATQVEMLYIGYLGRAGDPAGAAYWQSELARGDSASRLKSMAASFAVQPETGLAYPFLADPGQATPAEVTAFITAQYQELFGRTPDAPGLAYWQSYLTANLASPEAVGVFPLLLMFGAMNSELALDLTTLDNKATVAEFMVAQFAVAGIGFGSDPSAANTFAHQIVDQVNSTQDSVAAAEAAVLAFIQDQMELVGVSP